MRKVKTLALLMVGLAPAGAIKNRLLGMLGHQVHPTARIDPIVLYKVLRLEIGPRTHIWSGNLFKSARGVRMGSDCTMMRWNRVTAIPSFRRSTHADPLTVGILSLGDHVLVTKGHDIDCSGGFTMADWSAIAGKDCLVYSHSYDPNTHLLTCAHTTIGHNSFAAARTTLAMGAQLPDRSVLAMGGVLMPGATTTDTLYGGVPARPVRDISDWKMMDVAQHGQVRPPVQD